MRYRHRVILVPLLTAVLVLAACGDSDDDGGAAGGGGGRNTGRVNLFAAVEPEEAEPVQNIFDRLINAETDYTAEIEPSGNFEEQFQIRAEGGTLDLAAVPQPGAIPGLADTGKIVALEDLGFDIEELNRTFGESFVALGAHKGKHYGLPTNINLKSMVWYPKDDFDKAGYQVPTTFDELIALSDRIKAAGSTPWCVGFQSEGSTGWPATDWMEDIMLRTAGPETYDKWVRHEIPFNDPAVKRAGELFGKIMFTEGYVLGGAKATVDIAFGDAPRPMFDNPPKCWLHRQASFINAFFPDEAKAGVDYDWFPFPPIDREGTLFAGELTVVGNNRPEVVDFLRRFIARDVQCAMGGVEASSRISPHVEVGPDCYANKILADASTVLTEALKEGTGRFDASDLMPAEVGSGSFWTGMVKYIRSGPSSLDAVLADIERSWPT